jgi:hypothetical protein
MSMQKLLRSGTMDLCKKYLDGVLKVLAVLVALTAVGIALSQMPNGDASAMEPTEFGKTLFQRMGTDTIWLSNSRFVIRTIKLDTLQDTFDYVTVKLTHPIDWDLMIEDIKETLEKKK